MIEVLGRYELLRILGRGGMAEVYLARRRVAGLEKRLVVKRLRRERAGDPALLDLFMREAKLSMSLGHQNVVPVFDFGRVGDDAFLAMEYVDGRDLGSTLGRAGRPMPPLLAAYVASECCRALDHAHHRRAPDGGAAGVIHRDVTPRNVLLSWAGEVKLTDFGVATLASDGDDQIRGTWAYMAPEQARGEVIDDRVDLYALGLVLWSMLAGARPRPGDDPAALRAQACSGALPALPDGPPALIDVVRRATEAAPERRFADAHTMQEALDAYLIAARTEEVGPAPERRLAAWLAEVWGDDARRAELDEVGGEPMTADRTQRSIAVTVADGDGDDPAADQGALGSDPLRGAELVPPPPPSTADAPRRRWRPIALVVGGATVVVGLALAMTRPWTDPAADARARGARAAGPGAAPPATAAAPPALAAPPTGDGVTAPGSTSPTTPSAPARDPAAPPATGARPRPPAGPARPPVATTDPTRAPTPPPVLRRVTIGATPWADFTVDDDPTPHQTPETLSLPPGPHRIHLRNPTIAVERTITLDVPADRDVRHVERLEPR